VFGAPDCCIIGDAPGAARFLLEGLRCIIGRRRVRSEMFRECAGPEIIMRVWCEIGNVGRPRRDFANEGVSDG
jgi:hypothetical protein